MVDIRRCLVFPRSDHRYIVLAHQTAGAAMPDIQTNLFQLFSHPWASVAAQAEARLLLDVRQRGQIRSLSATGVATAEGPQTTRNDVHDTTHPPNREYEQVLFDKLKPHGFWLAKNTVAFFRISGNPPIFNGAQP